MIIETTAPTRVDLAGGTIDIPPLFLFHEGAATVNFAIDLLARCRIETREDDRIYLESVDRGDQFEIGLDEIDSLRDEPRLELLSKLVYFFRPSVGFNMITESEVPAGAGLAGSSTLNIACIGALNELVGGPYSPDKFIQIAANIETTVIKVPAGFQDYHSAQYGGVSCIHFAKDGMRREALDIDAATLHDRVVVIYTGEPRNSGTNNWQITKRHIDGDKDIFDVFEGIRDTSLALREALLKSEWDRVGEILRDAHPQRKRLSPNITTPHMDELIDAALHNGAIAAKVCGAGGGGCIAFFCEEGKKADVEHALSNADGSEVLKFNIRPSGLEINIQ
jgi:D-glycero-alpha-D-manno-heptose-7-phosphate kinase